MRNLLGSHGYTGVPSLLTETKIFWARDLDTSLRMRGEIGACFLALTYKRIVERNVLDGVCSWNDADGHYGKMSLGFAMYPSGHADAWVLLDVEVGSGPPGQPRRSGGFSLRANSPAT